MLGALDQRHRRGFLGSGEFSVALFNFTDETLRLIRQESLQLVGVEGSILSESWKIVLEEHVYAADALQIASCKQSECDVFVSADKTLLEKARSQGLKAFDSEKDEKKLRIL